MAKIEKTAVPSVGQVMEQLEFSYIAGGVKCYHLHKQNQV